MDFRPDINGLRAIAVLAVVGYHFGIPGFAGGFVGVDVFFVISGYLMTRIIVIRNEEERFSLLDFYLDRARRIVPALAVVILAVLAIGSIRLLPQDLLATGKEAAAAATFTSNILFWLESGYFAPQSQAKLLLHTWSLGVEWQFYLLWPLVVLAAIRLGGRRALLIVLYLLAVTSLALSIWLSAVRPTAAFFLLPPRAWEMLIGGLLFFTPPSPRRAGLALELTGFALILFAAVFARPDRWPGLGALVPVGGTILMMLARRTASPVTANPPFAWIGRASYSIYLWHWPVAVLLVRYDLAGRADWTAAGIAMSFLFGHLSHRFVERPDRNSNRWLGWDIIGWRRHVALGLPLAGLAAMGGFIWAGRGLPSRFSNEVRAIEADALPGGPYSKRCFSTAGAASAPCFIARDGRIVPDGKVLVTLVGDSHAEALVGSVLAALPDGTAGRLVFNGYAACPPLFGVISTDPENRCSEFARRTLKLQTLPRTTPLIVIAHWQGAIDNRWITFGVAGRSTSIEEIRRHIIDTSCALAAAGPTYVLLPTPEFPRRVASELQSRLIADRYAPEIEMPLTDHLTHARVSIALLHEAARTCGIRLIDPVPALCPGGTCRGSIGHRAVFRDTHHMTAFGGRLLTPLFAAAIRSSTH